MIQGLAYWQKSSKVSPMIMVPYWRPTLGSHLRLPPQGPTLGSLSRILGPGSHFSGMPMITVILSFLEIFILKKAVYPNFLIFQKIWKFKDRFIGFLVCAFSVHSKDCAFLLNVRLQLATLLKVALRNRCFVRF